MQLQIGKRKGSIVIMPHTPDNELTYRMKCYTVENERLFGDIIVTHQTVGRIYVPENWRGKAVYKRRRRNLTQETLETPDFMALNRINGSNHWKSSGAQKKADFFAVEGEKKKAGENNEEGVKKLRVMISFFFSHTCMEKL